MDLECGKYEYHKYKGVKKDHMKFWYGKVGYLITYDIYHLEYLHRQLWLYSLGQPNHV